MRKPIAHYTLVLFLALAAPGTLSKASGMCSSTSFTSTGIPTTLAITGAISISLLLGFSYYNYRLKQKNKILNTENNNLQKTVQEHSSTISKLKLDNNNLQAILNQKNATREQFQNASWKKQYDMAIETNQTLRKKNDMITKENIEIKSSIENMRNKINQLQSENAALEKNITQLNKENTKRELHDQGATIITLNAKIKKLEEELTIEKKKLAEEKNTIKNELKLAKEQIQLNQTANDFFTQNKDINNKDALLNRINILQETKRQLHTSTQKNKELELQCANLESQINTLTQENKTLREENASLRAIVNLENKS